MKDQNPTLTRAIRVADDLLLSQVRSALANAADAVNDAYGYASEIEDPALQVEAYTLIIETA